MIAKRERIELQDGDKTLGGSRPQSKIKKIGGINIVFLTDRALYHACDECVANEHFKCGVAVSSRQFGKQIIEKMASYICNSANSKVSVQCIINNRSESSIRWGNGSVLLVFTGNDNARGRAFHKLIVDGTIDSSLICNVLQPTEKLSIHIE